MKRSMIALLCAAAFLLSFAAPALAATEEHTVISFSPQEDQPVSYWRITMAATVVSNTGESLVVSLTTPRNMATLESDIVDSLQTLPMTADTAFTDSKGNALSADDLLPGQPVRVTFLYHWLNSTPRMPQMDRCLAVELVGDLKQAVSWAAVDDFDRDVLVGTVLSVSDRRLEVYVESGRVRAGNTEYVIRGRQRVTIPTSAAVTGANGNPILLSSIRPYQRVTMQVSDMLWTASMPPHFAAQEANRVQVLAEGERLFSAATLSTQNRMKATVLSISQGENGTVYTVQPVEGSRERALAERFTVAAPMVADFYPDQAAALDRLEVGSVVTIDYAGLVYGEGVEARIDWAHSIQLVEK